jgi:hypothetical protein
MHISTEGLFDSRIKVLAETLYTHTRTHAHTPDLQGVICLEWHPSMYEKNKGLCALKGQISSTHDADCLGIAFAFVLDKQSRSVGISFSHATF